MKNFFITIVILFITINLNAQWFLGGEMGLNVKDVNYNENASLPSGSFLTGNRENTTKRTDIGFMLAPEFGYYFNDKFALGLSFRIGTTFKADTTRTLTVYEDQDVVSTGRNIQGI
jgi:hypothetical protein